MAQTNPIGASGPLWLLTAPDALPPAWRARGVPMVLVPVTPSELDATMLRPAAAELSDEERSLLDLLRQGATLRVIARELGTSTRTAQRRIAALRDRAGVRTTAELLVSLNGYPSGARASWNGRAER